MNQIDLLKKDEYLVNVAKELRIKEKDLKFKEEVQNRKDIDLKIREEEQKQKELREQKKKKIKSLKLKKMKMIEKNNLNI